METIVQPFPGVRRLETLCYLLVWIGALSLLLVPQAPVQVILAFCLILVPSLFLNVSAFTHSVYRSAWRIIMAAFIVLSLLDWRWNGRPLPQTLIAQMCFFQLYKAYNSKNYVDYLQMVLFAVLMVVLSGLIGSSILFLAILVPFIAVMVGFQQMLNLCRQYLQESKGGPPLGYQVARERLGARELRLSPAGWAAQTLAIVAIGLLIFYLLPRKHVFNPSYFGGSNMPGRDPVMTGLSGGVTLRHFSAVKNDPTPAVKATFETRPPRSDQIYLRSGSLEKLHNSEWYAQPHRLPLTEAEPDGSYWFERIDPADRPLLIRHEVEFLNSFGQVPLALPGLVAVSDVEAQMPRNLGVYQRLSWLTRYTAYSWGVERPPDRPVAPEEPAVLMQARELEPGLSTGPIHLLANEVSYFCSNDLQRARAIEQYLRSRYGYTLDIQPLNGPAQGPSPIHRFLFDYRQGNCEVFASAMAVLCRNLEIPARLAIGYHGGTDGDSPNEIVFRNQDAHAWVEVWSADRGWVTFDPTPPSPMEAYSGRFQFKKIMEWVGSANAGWNRAIVWYDNDTKMKWMAAIWEPVDQWMTEARFGESTFFRLSARMRQNISRPEVLTLSGFLIALNCVAAGLYFEVKRRWRNRKRPAAARIRRQDPWVRFYGAIVGTMRAKAAIRLPGQTPREFLEALAGERTIDMAFVQPVADFYHSGRFGNVSWSQETARQAEALLRDFSERLNEGAGAGRAEFAGLRA